MVCHDINKSKREHARIKRHIRQQIHRQGTGCVRLLAVGKAWQDREIEYGSKRGKKRGLRSQKITGCRTWWAGGGRLSTKHHYMAETMEKYQYRTVFLLQSAFLLRLLCNTLQYPGNLQQGGLTDEPACKLPWRISYLGNTKTIQVNTLHKESWHTVWKGQKLQERRVRKLAVRKQMVSTLLWRAGNLKIGRNTIGSAQHIGDRELRVDLDKNLAFQTSYK